MYEPPIKFIMSDLELQTNKIIDRIDRHVFEAVTNIGIDVDADELIKALSYDRQQYEKGYIDGRRFQSEATQRTLECRKQFDEWLVLPSAHHN